jgi:hypothetical protein
MSVMSHRRRQACLKVVDALLTFKVSRCFTIATSTLVRELPGYAAVVAKPMTLLEIKNELINGTCSCFSDFKKSVELVWENARISNAENSLVRLSADFLSEEFQKLTRFMSDDEAGDWMARFKYLVDYRAAVLTGFSRSVPEPQKAGSASNERKRTRGGRQQKVS